MKLFPGYALNSEQQKVIFLAGLGGMLEFYDFTIYGLFATYFASQFFPSKDSLIAIIASYTIFVVGYVIRPLGGILFSHIGDEIGRKSVLILTMVLMGLSSLGMGLLPTYAQIGLAAPALMLLLRLIQGLAIGGELPSMIVYVSETMPQLRGYGMGGVFSLTVAGLIPGMLLNLWITHHFSPEQLHAFGWRIPFLIGGVLCFIAYRVRRELHETSAFKKLKHHRLIPFLEVIKHHNLKVMIGIGLIAAIATPITLAIIFMPTYLINILHFAPQAVSDTIFAATVVSVIAAYIMGIVANKFNLFTVTKYSLLGMLIAGAICYWLLSLHNYLTLAVMIFALLQGAVIPLMPIFLSYLFPIDIRLTGVALSYNLSFVVFAGLVPLFVTSIIDLTHLQYLAPAVALFICVALGLCAVSAMRKTQLD
jgi:MFS family permease